MHLQALKASPTDGWKELVSGETVSVYLNDTNKVPFPMTCVRCKFQCPVPPNEVLRHLQDLKARRERDFFFKEGKSVGEKQKAKLNFQAIMKTLSSAEERPVLVSHQWEQGGNGGWTIVEVPEGTQDLSGFTFPSFSIEADSGGSQSSVIALYRFDVRKVWKEKAGESDEKLAEALSERFSEYAQHTCLSLLMLGGGGQAGTPEPKTKVQAMTTPSALSPAPSKKQPADPLSPQGSPSPTKTPLTPSSGARQKKESGVGELIEGSKYRWKKGELIGHGAIGKVYMGLNFESGIMMAVKQVQLGQQLGAQAADELKAMDQEIHIFSMISHPNLVRYYGMEKTETEVYIFLEYVSGGSISQMLRKFGAFSETMVGSFTAQIVDGLDYLHSNGICHRDIKAANILYSNEGVVKLADFGTSKKIADVANMSVGLKSLVGTPYMMAPEVIRQTGHSLPADVWSLACVIWEMATTKHPFTQYTDRMVAMYNIAHAKAPPEPPEVLSDTAKDFVRKCMQIEATKRATTKELLLHPFISAVERKTDLTSPSAVSKPPTGAIQQMHDATPSKDDFVQRRELSRVEEDDEKELGSRQGARSRTSSRTGQRYTASADADDWGNVSADSVGASGGKSKKSERRRDKSPLDGLGILDRGHSPPARPSILDGLPPDPFKGSSKLPSGSDLIADLTSSDEDELADSPVRNIRNTMHGNDVGVRKGAPPRHSKLTDPEEEDEVRALLKLPSLLPASQDLPPPPPQKKLVSTPA